MCLTRFLLADLAIDWKVCSWHIQSLATSVAQQGIQVESKCHRAHTTVSSTIRNLWSSSYVQNRSAIDCSANKVLQGGGEILPSVDQ